MLSLFLLLNVFILIAPGIVLVSFFDFDIAYNVNKSFKAGTLIKTFNLVFLSYIILFAMLCVFVWLFKHQVKIEKIKTNTKFATYLLVVSVCVIILRIGSIGNIPLLMALKGDFLGAGNLKVLIITNQVGISGFLTGYIFKFFPTVVLMYCFINQLKNPEGKNIFYISLFVTGLYSVFDLQKSALVFLLFILFSLKVSYASVKLKSIFSYFIVGLTSLFVSFYLLYDLDIALIFDKILSRMFVGQGAGLYMMIDALQPSIDRLMYGAPLTSLFNVNIIDPAREIVQIFFPTAGDGWLNSNTYIFGDAWSAMGYFALIVMPLFVVLNLILLIILRSVFSRFSSGYSNVVYIYCLMTMPINNSFSTFLFFKPAQTYIILMTFYVLISLMHREKQLKITKGNEL